MVVTTIEQVKVQYCPTPESMLISSLFFAVLIWNLYCKFAVLSIDYGSFTELLKVEEQWPSVLSTSVELLCITNAYSLV